MEDPHRPRYHFSPPSNWLNDPNGLTQWKGQYHLFYQYNPHEPRWGPMYWGHAVSPDLLHWTHLPIALAPTPDSLDADGCWSGCFVNHDGTPTLIYSGNHHNLQLPCLATSHDDLLTWQKYPGNPLLSAPPAGLDLVAFRDHSIWREGDTWFQAIGSGIKGQGGAVLLYRSPNLFDWTYLHLLHAEQQTRGDMWECPDFFPLAERHVLIVSPISTHTAIYFSGTYREQSFQPDVSGMVDVSSSFYAPQSFFDEQGRRLLFGWLCERRPAEELLAAGWAGAMSLPRVLSLHDDGTLRMTPAPELTALRQHHYHLSGIDLTDTVAALQAVRGDTLELSAVFEPGNADMVGVKVRVSPDHEEETCIVYQCREQRLFIDRTRSRRDNADTPTHESGVLTLSDGEYLQLHIYLDCSIVEVFANERLCVTERIYPTRADSLGIDVFAHGDGARLVELDVWQLA